jgi:integrase
MTGLAVIIEPGRSRVRRLRRRARQRRRSRTQCICPGHTVGILERLAGILRLVPRSCLQAATGRARGHHDVSAGLRQDARRGLDRPAYRGYRALPRSGRPPEPDGAPDREGDLERRAAHDRHRADGQGRTDHRRPAPIVAGFSARPIDVRDRALLLLGFGAALRRSEIVALDVGDLAFVPEGASVLIRRSKTDQEGAGVLLGVPFGSNPDTCPVRALQVWIALLDDGPPARRCSLGSTGIRRPANGSAVGPSRASLRAGAPRPAWPATSPVTRCAQGS